MSRVEHFSDGANEDYHMRHTAPGPDDAPMHDIEQVMPDFYSHPEWYHHGARDDRMMDRRGTSVINGARGNPDRLVSIYRAVPSHVEQINPGDWVTQSPDYAEMHRRGMEQTDEFRGQPGHVLSKQVRAAELHTDGNSLHEWGWNPRT